MTEIAKEDNNPKLYCGTYGKYNNGSIKGKLAFGQHPECPSLMVLQVKSYGVWYDVPGTTVHSTNDKGKVAIIEKYANAIGLTD